MFVDFFLDASGALLWPCQDCRQPMPAVERDPDGHPFLCWRCTRFHVINAFHSLFDTLSVED